MGGAIQGGASHGGLHGHVGSVQHLVICRHRSPPLHLLNHACFSPDPSGVVFPIIGSFGDVALPPPLFISTSAERVVCRLPSGIFNAGADRVSQPGQAQAVQRPRQVFAVVW